MRGWICFFVLIIQTLAANDQVYELDFSFLQDPQAMGLVNGKRIKIRGFLYLSPSGDWILAAEPDLKSCCIGSKSKANQQIFLDGHFDPQLVNYAHEISGVIHIDAKDQEERYYYLQKAVLLKKNRDYSTIAIGVIVFGICICVMVIFFRNK
jgi:hypothetical protein